MIVIRIRAPSLVDIARPRPVIPISNHITKARQSKMWSNVAIIIKIIGYNVMRMQANHLFYKSYWE